MIRNIASRGIINAGSEALTRLAGSLHAAAVVASFSLLLCSSRILLRPPTLLLFASAPHIGLEDGGASSRSSEAALTSSLLLLLPCCCFSLNSGRSTMERRCCCWWSCWCCLRRCCRRADRSSGRLLYSGGFPLRSLALSRRVGDTRPYRVGRKVGGCTVGGGGGPRTVTFLGSVPFLLRLLASRRDSGAVDDEAAGEAAEAAAGDMDISGLLGGETVRPQPNRPRRKLVVAERLREDLGAEAGGPSSCEASEGLAF